MDEDASAPISDFDELVGQLEKAMIDYDADLIAGNLFQAAHATIVAQAREIHRLLVVNGEMALEWTKQLDRAEAAQSAGHLR